MSASPLLGLVGQDQGSRIDTPATVPVAPRAEAEPPPAPAVLTPDGRRGPWSGQAWGGYDLGDLLGEGGMGAVYRACQRAIGRVVAFKVLGGGAESEAGARSRFANEARAAALVDSPHVVRLHDSGEHQGRLWLAMEYVPGRTLAEELRRRPGLSPVEAAGWVLQAARGLAAAHRCGLVHRDIKPANLLIAGDGTLKIADFGLARLAGARTLTVTGTVLGTPQYIAPEQGRGLEADARSDLYSLGTVLYELLTGRPPFTGDAPDALIFQHNFAEPELPAALNPDVPRDLQAVCLKCLQKDPARRFTDAGALVIDLERVLAGLAPVSALFDHGAPSTGAEEALRRLAGWRRRWWPLAGAVLALAALAAGWWWWDARRGAERELRARLAPLALAAPVPATAGADLERLAVLAQGDPAVAHARGKLAALAALGERIEVMAREPEPGHAALERMRRALAEMAELVGPAGDARMARWQAWIAAAEAREAALRARLAARLQGVELAPDALRAVVADDLARLRALAGPDDPALRAWEALLARSAEAQAADRAQLARLDRPEPLRLGELPALAAALARLAALAGPEAVPAGAAARLDAEAGERAAAAALLARLEAKAAPDPGERAAARQALARLEASEAIAGDERARWHARLEAVEAELSALRARLAVLDAPRSPPSGLGDDLARYEALAGFQDPQATLWRRRWEEQRLLRARLAPLARAETPPAGADADLAALAALVGADDPQVAAGAARLARIAALRQRLAPLAAPGALPDKVDDDLAALAGLVGGHDAVLRAGRERVDEQRRLAAELERWDPLLVLPGEQVAAARGALDRHRALAGDDARQQRAARRLAELLGPPRPAWAAACGHDRHGPWAELAVDGAVQRLRWIPPLAGRIGSPADEPGRDGDESPVRVRLTRGWWLADGECAQDLWQAVMGGNPAHRRDPRHPVEQVDAAAAEDFCRRLGLRLPACRARLPGEAEWELALRAGAEGPWGGLAADQLAAAVVHRGAGGTRAVGQGPLNVLGLGDGAGNVWEWCAGGYQPPPAGELVEDPPIPSGARRVARGGSWNDPLAACRLANRVALDPATASRYLGFRFAVEDAR